jgi:hypothetical protein
MIRFAHQSLSHSVTQSLSQILRFKLLDCGTVRLPTTTGGCVC